MSAVPDADRFALVLRWAHQAFDLLCDLEQVTAGCADRQRYLRLLSLVREHNVYISGRQFIVCKASDPGRAAVLVAPERTHVLRSPRTLDDPYEQPPLMFEDAAVAFEELRRSAICSERAGEAAPTIDEIVQPIERHLVT
jgi:hypothetical protein